MDVVLNTEETCFLCLQQFSVASPDGETPEVNSLWAVCRYLKINTSGLLVQSLKNRLDPEEVVKWDGKEYNFWGKFCQNCGQVTKCLSKLIMDLDVMQMLIKQNLEKYLELLGLFNRDFMGDGKSQDDRLAGMLREEVKWKCADKVDYLERTAAPNVLLSRCEMDPQVEAESQGSFYEDNDDKESLISSPGQDVQILENSEQLMMESVNPDAPPDPTSNSTLNDPDETQNPQASTSYSSRVLRSDDENKVTVCTNHNQTHEALETAEQPKPKRSKIEESRVEANEKSLPVPVENTQEIVVSNRKESCLLDAESTMKTRMKHFVTQKCRLRKNDQKFECSYCSVLCSKSKIRLHLTDDHPDKLLGHLKQHQVSEHEFKLICQRLIGSLIIRQKNTYHINGVWICALCNSEYNYNSGANYHLLVSHAREISNNLKEIQEKGIIPKDRIKNLVVARCLETNQTSVLLQFKKMMKQKIKTVMTKQCSRTNELGVHGQRKYLCGFCKMQICNTKIRNHLAAYHAEKLLDFVKQAHISEPDFQTFCEHVLATEQSKLVSKLQNVGMGDKMKLKFVKTCHFCKTGLNDNRFVRYHFLMCHSEILVKKLEEIQEEVAIPILTRNETREMDTSGGSSSSDNEDHSMMPVLERERRESTCSAIDVETVDEEMCFEIDPSPLIQRNISRKGNTNDGNKIQEGSDYIMSDESTLVEDGVEETTATEFTSSLEEVVEEGLG